MDFLNINETVQSVIRISKGVAREYGNASYAPAHLLFALMHKEVGLRSFVESLGKDADYLREWAEVRIEEYPKAAGAGEIMPDGKVNELFEQADNVRIKWGLLEINPLCLLAAIATPEAGFSTDELRSFPIREREIHDLFTSGMGNMKKSVSTQTDLPGSEAPLWTAGAGNLDKYCTDKTALAADKKVYPIVCREREPRMMMEILGRMGKPNVLIIGDAGVGKTALVDGLACSIIEGTVPQYLKDMTIYELDTGTLIAGATYKGEIEERLKGIIKELSAHGNAILFIDEIHTLIDPKSGNSGAASILKPELAKGNITVIGVTTVDEYRKLIEPDHALNRRFEVLQVSEPDLASTVNMIQAALERYESYHGVGVDVDSLPECVALAKRYVKERRLPDAAIDLIDRTLSAVKMINQSGEKDIKGLAEQLAAIEAAEDQPEAERTEKLRLVNFTMKNRLSPILLGMISDGQNEPESSDYGEWMDYILSVLDRLRELTKEKIGKITSHEVAAVVSSSTGIPIGKIESGEKEKLLNMEDILRRRVVGQDNALKVLTDAIVESRSGMNKPGQPIGSFFLLGPTGTGKTELAKALAEALFGNENSMIRVDMSEFMEPHSVAKLIGAPPGYVGYEEGGQLTEKIRRRPYSVILFDEVEKAHPDVMNMLLQILEDGRLTDAQGRTVNFKNTVIIMTSNVGAKLITEKNKLGFAGGNVEENKNQEYEAIKKEVMGELKKQFRPELINRIDDIIVFHKLEDEDIKKIIDIMLVQVQNRLSAQNIKIDIDQSVKDLIAKKGVDTNYGARPLRRAIQNMLEDKIAEAILDGVIKPKKKAKAVVKDDKIVIE